MMRRIWKEIYGKKMEEITRDWREEMRNWLGLGSVPESTVWPTGQVELLITSIHASVRLFVHPPDP
jgi:hypothetical protein